MFWNPTGMTRNWLFIGGFPILKIQTKVWPAIYLDILLHFILFPADKLFLLILFPAGLGTGPLSQQYQYQL